MRLVKPNLTVVLRSINYKRKRIPVVASEYWMIYIYIYANAKCAVGCSISRLEEGSSRLLDPPLMLFSIDN